MMRGEKSLVFFILSGLLLGPDANAIVPDTAGNPYQGITDRNIFALKPPPAPPRPEDNKQPPPNIKLTGITTILGRKQALLLVDVPAKPPQPAKQESYILTEGQRDGDIEIVAINEKEGVVKVKNHGEPQTLDFVNNGVKVPAGSSMPMAAAPGAPPMPAMAIPPPPSSSGNPGGMRQIPTRPVRMISGSGGDNGQQALAYGGGAANPGFAGYGGASAAPAPPAEPALPYEQQITLIELERERMKQEGDETVRIMPPTELTPADGGSIFAQ